MNADTILWAAIALMTFGVSRTDIDVIHGRYMLTLKQKLNIYVHQFIILVVTIGILFQKRSNIQTHMFLTSVCVACWLWFDGCFMAEWQREQIPYTEDDLAVIQKPEDVRFREFIWTIPILIFDLYKLANV
jgi:hypothetical protein